MDTFAQFSAMVKQLHVPGGSTCGHVPHPEGYERHICLGYVLERIWALNSSLLPVQNTTQKTIPLSLALPDLC